MFRFYPISIWITYLCIYFIGIISFPIFAQDSSSMEELLQTVEEALSKPKHTTSENNHNRIRSTADKVQPKSKREESVDILSNEQHPRRMASTEVFEAEPIQSKLQAQNKLTDSPIQLEGHILSLHFLRGNRLQMEDTDYLQTNSKTAFAFGVALWLQSKDKNISSQYPGLWTGIKTQISFSNRDIFVEREGIYQDSIYMNSTDILASAPWVIGYSLQNHLNFHIGIGPNLHSTYLLSNQENISGYGLYFSEHWETGVSKNFQDSSFFAITAFYKSWLINSSKYAASARGLQISIKRNI